MRDTEGMGTQSLSENLTDIIGRRIVSLEWPPGYRFTLENLMDESGTSRTVVREVMKELEGLRLIASKRRVGMEVLADEHWNVFDPRLIRWRLEGSGASDQYRSLMQLRRAIEPIAGELCARFGPRALKTHLLETAQQMRVEGEAGRLQAFLSLDILFHSLILEGSGNEMFRALKADVEEVLRGRTHQGRMPQVPEPDALDLHEAVAMAIYEGRDKDARRALRALVDEAAAGVEAGFGRM